VFAVLENLSEGLDCSVVSFSVDSVRLPVSTGLVIVSVAMLTEMYGMNMSDGR